MVSGLSGQAFRIEELLELGAVEEILGRDVRMGGVGAAQSSVRRGDRSLARSRPPAVLQGRRLVKVGKVEDEPIPHIVPPETLECCVHL